MSKGKTGKALALILGVLTMSILLSYPVLAWTEPSGPPPTGNVPAPINVGSVAQTKTGNLTILGNFYAPAFYDSDNSDWLVNPSGPTVLKGNIGIGATTTPVYTLDVTGTLRATATTTFSGNVGIGTTTPSGKLQVVGDGVVVGNPTGGDKGAGSINAEKIYVQGTELVSEAVTYVISTSTPISGDVINSKSSSWTCPSGRSVVNIFKSATYDSCCSYSISGSTITVNVRPYVWVDKCINSLCESFNCVGCAGYCTDSVSTDSWCANWHPPCGGNWGWGRHSPYSNSCTVEFQCATKINVGS